MAADQQARRVRRVRIFWMAAAGIAVAAVAIALIPRAAEADFAAIDRGTVHVDLVDEGRTRMHDVYVVSAPVSGRVERVEVEPGDAVAAGVVVARMTPAGTGFLDLRNDQQARAAVGVAEARLRAAGTERNLSLIHISEPTRPY